MKVIYKIRKHVLLITFVYFILFTFFWILLGQLGFEYLFWFKIFSVLLIVFGMIFGTVLKIKHTAYEKKDKTVLLISYLFFEVFISVIVLCIVSFSLLYESEKLVFIEDRLYVEKRHSFLLSNWIDYYKFSNFLFRSKEASFTKNYNNSLNDFDYIGTTYYDEDAHIIPAPSLQEAVQIESMDSNIDIFKEVLYTQKISDQIYFRVSKIDQILAQRNIVIVEKSIDGGNTYVNQLENDTHTLTVYDSANYVFLNEMIGFINHHSVSGKQRNNRGIIVTRDGGKTFEEIKLAVEDSMLDYLYFEDVPYIEDGKLKLVGQLYFSKIPEQVYFISDDRGLTWKKSELYR